MNSDIVKILNKIIVESEPTETNYMFFSNLKEIITKCSEILKMDKSKIDNILTDGHDWADDHISEAKTNISQVYDFLRGEVLNEGKKKTGTKLCSRGKSAAKSKFKVYPSAYANGYAVQVCKGTKPGLDGKKRCSPPYC